MIFETHAHYDDEAFDTDREELLSVFLKNGIEKVVNIGSNVESSKKTVELTQKYPFFYGAVGVHPSDVQGLKEEDIQEIKELSKQDKIVAVGEIGLDYYYGQEYKEIQKVWFERQLFLAKEVEMPVVIHSRDALKDTMEIMRAVGELRADIHCFSYSKEGAREFLNRGYYLGIGGVITFKNAKKLKEVVEYMPMDRILLETDAPYLTPEPNRGKRNCSFYLSYVAEEIAKIKKIELEQVIELTNQNARRFYGI